MTKKNQLSEAVPVRLSAENNDSKTTRRWARIIWNVGWSVQTRIKCELNTTLCFPTLGATYTNSYLKNVQVAYFFTPRVSCSVVWHSHTKEVGFLRSCLHDVMIVVLSNPRILNIWNTDQEVELTTWGDLKEGRQEAQTSVKSNRSTKSGTELETAHHSVC